MSWTVPVLGAHVLDPRNVGFKVPIAVPTETMIWAPDVVPPPRIVTRKIKVTVITGPVGVGILLVLRKGSIVWEPPLTAIAIRHQTVRVRRLKCVAYRMWGLDHKLYEPRGKLVHGRCARDHPHVFRFATRSNCLRVMQAEKVSATGDPYHRHRPWKSLLLC